MSHLDTADETDRPAVIIEGDQQMVTWVREEGVGGYADGRAVIQRSGSLNLLNGGRLEDPHEADATSCPQARRSGRATDDRKHRGQRRCLQAYQWR